MFDRLIPAGAVMTLIFSWFIGVREFRPTAVQIAVCVVGVLTIAVALLVWLGTWSVPDIVTGSILGVFISIVTLSVYGMHKVDTKMPTLQFHLEPSKSGHDSLFVLFHGFGGGPRTWTDVEPELLNYGDVLLLNYPAVPASDIDPLKLSEAMATEIRRINFGAPYKHITFVGHSVGALLARQVYLMGVNAKEEWAMKIKRIVLLAGMNRGWDISGKRPMDMSVGTWLSLWIGSWLGRLTNSGHFILSAEMGAPFVANLRIEWLRWFKNTRVETPVVVQLLGDIDDLVSDEDNQDLRAASSSSFFWIKVRGTGHNDIYNFMDRSGSTSTYNGIGDYRRKKFLLAATGDPSAIKAASEELGYTPDRRVSDVVFILHGIRDLGAWSADFEGELQRQFDATGRRKLAIVPLRYGFFSMGSFLMQPNRQKYVRWLMDQYTETLARYPEATRIGFFAHSNGTYLLAKALEDYSSIRLDRVAFAGSVVRREYRWENVELQVNKVRNYFARDDAVVGLFPRFFELPGVRWMQNQVGSAGYNRFNESGANLENVQIAGGHSAFLGYVPEIAAFLLAGGSKTVTPPASMSEDSLTAAVLRWGIFPVWAAIIFVVVFPGIRVAIAAGEIAWIPTLIYAVIVILLLQRL